MVNLELTSSAFRNGEEIPTRYGYKNENISPPLTINGVPEGTKSLALIMDDPDAMGAVGKVWVHWVVFNHSPSVTVIPEGLHTEKLRITSKHWVEHSPDSKNSSSKFLRQLQEIGQFNDVHIGLQGLNDFDFIGYGGPAPPDKRHTYVFTLYALNIHELKGIPNVGSPGTKSDIEKAMEGHILEQATLTGTYAP